MKIIKILFCNYALYQNLCPRSTPLMRSISQLRLQTRCLVLQILLFCSMYSICCALYSRKLSKIVRNFRKLLMFSHNQSILCLRVKICSFCSTELRLLRISFSLDIKKFLKLWMQKILLRLPKSFCLLKLTSKLQCALEIQ